MIFADGTFTKPDCDVALKATHDMLAAPRDRDRDRRMWSALAICISRSFATISGGRHEPCEPPSGHDDHAPVGIPTSSGWNAA
jgi:hypothetical protein